jgi:hypothetical protein
VFRPLSAQGVARSRMGRGGRSRILPVAIPGWPPQYPAVPATVLAASAQTSCRLPPNDRQTLVAPIRLNPTSSY